VTNVKDPGVSKVKLALGAASLFLFIVGVKRTFRSDDGAEFSGKEDIDWAEPEDEAPVPAPKTKRLQRSSR
jgi:hypothetical protein